VSLFTSSVSPGGSISYSFTRENIGGEGPSGISTWDHMGYLSLDTQYDSSDIALPWTFSVSTYHLSPGWSNSLTKTKPIPSDVPPGSYHLIFREDIGGPPNNYPGVVESNENNNWKASANTVLVQGGSSRIQNDTNLTQMAELLRGLQLLLNQIEYLP
jgi:hypothetical protein